MITFEEDIRNENIKDIAKMLMTAARTAPKARGTDNLVLAVATDETIVEIAEKMKQLAVERDMEFLNRDAENILNCGAVVLFGMKISPLGLNCGACGFKTCGEKPKNIPCFFNANDLGIAIGSLLIGAIIAAYSYQLAFILCGLLTLSSIVYFKLLVQRKTD